VIERVAHGLSQTGTTGDSIELFGEPDVHCLDQRFAALLACQPAIFGGLAADIGFNRIEGRDAQKRFLGQRCLRRDLDLVELPPRMAPAVGELDAGVRGVPDQTTKPGVAIDLEKTTEPFQVNGGVLTLAVFAVNISGGGLTGTAPGPVIDRVAPQPSGLRLSLARIEHRQRRVIGEDFGRGQNGAEDPFVQRRQPPAGAANPAARCGTIQRHALTGEDLGLTVQWQMIAVPADQHMREQRFGRQATVDRTIRRGRLHDSLLAGPAAITRPADHSHLEPGRDVIQHLRAVFADGVQRSAATGTGLVVNVHDDLDPRQIRRQRAAIALRRFGARRVRGSGIGFR
jgi:hypothetical protein